MLAEVKVSPAEVFDALAAVFRPTQSGRTRWVSFKTDTGVDVTFFGPDATIIAGEDDDDD